MKHIRLYDNYIYVDPTYQYIRYKIDNKANMILRFNQITNDAKLLDIDTNTFTEFISSIETLKSMEKSDYLKKPGSFWRMATEEEIEQFKITEYTNKYNI